VKETVSAFTVDVEDYFQVSGFERHISRAHWDHHESRVVRNTYRVLSLLSRHNVRATFFVLGWVADRYPRLVREIHECGHQVGSHSYWHRLVYQQTPEEFRDDLRHSRQVIEDAIGAEITAYRAPSFSITASSLWAMDILAEEGFRIDSSVFPVHHDRYGIPGAPRQPHRIQTPAGPLWEFPPSVCRFLGWNVPVSGGGYFRLYPLRWTLRCVARIHATGMPFLFYVHPWELDPEQPRLRLGSPGTRFRHYVNLGENERKLDALLRTVRFGPLTDAIGHGETRLPCHEEGVGVRGSGIPSTASYA